MLANKDDVLRWMMNVFVRGVGWGGIRICLNICTVGSGDTHKKTSSQRWVTPAARKKSCDTNFVPMSLRSQAFTDIPQKPWFLILRHVQTHTAPTAASPCFWFSMRFYMGLGNLNVPFSTSENFVAKRDLSSIARTALLLSQTWARRALTAAA